MHVIDETLLWQVTNELMRTSVGLFLHGCDFFIDFLLNFIVGSSLAGAWDLIWLFGFAVNVAAVAVAFPF